MEHRRGDLQNPRLIIAKGGLFLVLGLLASALLLARAHSLAVAALLVIAVWSFCRFYYFAFYVIEHYVDADYRFSGLYDCLRYLARRRHRPAKAAQAAEIDGAAGAEQPAAD